MVLTACGTVYLARRPIEPRLAVAVHQILVVLPEVVIASKGLSLCIALDSKLTATTILAIQIACRDVVLLKFAMPAVVTGATMTRTIGVIHADKQRQRQKVRHAHVECTIAFSLGSVDNEMKTLDTYKSVLHVPPLTQNTCRLSSHTSTAGCSQYCPA